ncbi:MAG: nucleoside-diphosphate kinase [bacterium]
MQQTLAIIKPDAVKKNVIGDVIDRIETDGLTIKSLKMIQLREEQAEEFYAEHRGTDFFDGLVDFMTSAPVVPAVVEGEDAITRLRTLMGETDPSEAAPGTIRAELADGLPNNIIHGSDSPESAERELSFFFSQAERL